MGYWPWSNNKASKPMKSKRRAQWGFDAGISNVDKSMNYMHPWLGVDEDILTLLESLPGKPVAAGVPSRTKGGRTMITTKKKKKRPKWRSGARNNSIWYRNKRQQKMAKWWRISKAPKKRIGNKSFHY